MYNFFRAPCNISDHLQLRRYLGQLLSLVDPLGRIVNQLINHSLGTLLLVHNSGGLAH
jgi:hypothetical protein